MKDHETIRASLPLAAAGALEPEEERRVRAHTAVCESCAAELQRWQALSDGLAALPVEQAPVALVARTQARVRAALREEEERRWEAVALAFAALLSWAVGLSTWAVWRLFTAGAAAWSEVHLTQFVSYLAISTLAVWLTAGAAVVVAGQHRRAAGRNL